MSASSRKYTLTALILSAALMLRAISAGDYLPILDDSIQYINFPRSLDFIELIRSNGLFASRPLAILTDLFFVGSFKEHLIIPVLIFAAMHGVTAVLFWRLFERRFGTGLGFAVFFALLPLNVEGTYWLSAASRIVPGLFFCAVTANLLDDFIEIGGIWRAVTLPLSALLSYAFYEQILVLSFTLTVLQFAGSIKKYRRAWAAALTLPMLAAYFIFTGINSADGAFAGRITLVFPTSLWYFTSFLPTLMRQIGAAFIKGGVLTLFCGFARGIAILSAIRGGGILLCIFLLFGGMIKALSRHNQQYSKPHRDILIFGSILLAAPLVPYFVVANPWFSIRGTVPCTVAAGLLFDLLIRIILRRERIYTVFCAIFASVCIIAGISEVHDFHAVARYDDILADAILEASDGMEGRVGILCVEAYPIKDANYIYHEHVGSAGGAEWSLHGKLAAKNGKELDFSPVPLGVEDFTFYRLWNRDTKRISGFDSLWLWDDESCTLTPLVAVRSGGVHDFEIFYEYGTPFGRVFEEGEFGYIKIY